jgi:PAS domain S-box-containing protein
LAADGENGAAAGEEQFRLLADHAPVLIWRADTSKACDFFNKPWLDFTGRGLEQELGFGWAEGVHPEDFDRCIEIFTTAFDARQDFTMDYRLRRHDGAWRWVLDNGRPFFVQGAFAGYFGSCIDVTDMKAALEERRLALEEREVLLQELQHRVKNNAQSTTSVLRLHASRSSNPEVAERLHSAAERVHAAALVQDRLFQLPSFTRVDLGEQLAAAANSAIGRAGDGVALKIEHGASISVSVTQAMPLALAVSELVSNAAKHAFPNRMKGQVSLSMQPREESLAEVTVADDGVGMPAHFRASGVTPPEPRRGALGLELTARLLQQVGGSLTVTTGSGTAVSLTFPIR